MHLLGIDCFYFEPKYLNIQIHRQNSKKVLCPPFSDHLSLPVLPPIVNNFTDFNETTCSSQPLTQCYLQLSKLLQY